MREMKGEGGQKEQIARTESWMFRRIAVAQTSMNAVSSSLSVYHGPPLSSALGVRSYNMYVFLVGRMTFGTVLMSLRDSSFFSAFSAMVLCRPELEIRVLRHTPCEGEALVMLDRMCRAGASKGRLTFGATGGDGAVDDMLVPRELSFT